MRVSWRLNRAELLSLYVYLDVVSYLNFLFFTNRIVEIVCMLKSSVVSGHPSLKICTRRFPCINLFLYNGITASRCHCTATAFCSRQEMYQPRLHSLGEYTTISQLLWGMCELKSWRSYTAVHFSTTQCHGCYLGKSGTVSPANHAADWITTFRQMRGSCSIPVGTGASSLKVLDQHVVLVGCLMFRVVSSQGCHVFLTLLFQSD